MNPPAVAAMVDQPSLWQQQDLLGLLAGNPQPETEPLPETGPRLETGPLLETGPGQEFSGGPAAAPLPGPTHSPAPQAPLAGQPLAGDQPQGHTPLQSLQALAAASGGESNLGFNGESIYNSPREKIAELITVSGADLIDTEIIACDPALISTEPGLINPEPIAPDLIGSTLMSPEPVAAEPVATEAIDSEPVNPVSASSDPVIAELVAPEPISPESIILDPVIPDPVIPDPVILGLVAPEVISPASTSSTLITPEPINSELIAEPAVAAPVCPGRLLIVDTETSGLDPATGKCLEVGAVLFDVPHRAVLSQLSFLLPASANPAQHVNGIDPAVTRLEQPWRQSLQMLDAMVAGADAVLAHNAAFDRQWFGIEPLPALDRPWICTMDDIPWPADRQLKPRPSLQALALAYGVPVWAAHRALTDCIYLVQVLERCADLEQLLVEAQEPRQLFRAQLSYAERFRAKQAGFRWNDPVAGAWSRRLSEREARSLPFPVQPVCA
jgi:DNA polymerase-3 subunit epsilon